jgi:hypothetical protein
LWKFISQFSGRIEISQDIFWDRISAEVVIGNIVYRALKLAEPVRIPKGIAA